MDDIMIDPLQGFSWSTLYKRYDNLCKAHYNRNHSSLSAIRPPPLTDRQLYYYLVNQVASERKTTSGISLDTYVALLYWKHYSNPQNKIYEKVYGNPRPGELRCKIYVLSQSLPAVIEKNAVKICNLVRSMDKFELLGIKTGSTLPTRTTLLHMIYPNIVPIFDKMVLKAVGVSGENVNTADYKLLEQYIKYAWYLAKKHSSHFYAFNKETPLRLIDMALWVIRGGCKGGC